MNSKPRTPAGIYTRNQGATVRYYARIGGERMPLKPPGEKRATTDPEVAQALFAQLVMDHQKTQLRAIHSLPKVAVSLFAAAEEHLKLKAAAGRVRTQTIEADELNLERACAFFGADTLLEAITPQQVGQWATHLQTTPVAARRPEGTNRGKRASRVMGASNARKCLNSLSNLYRRAQEQGWVSMGVNPVGALMSKPQDKHHESRWFEAHEVALLLESARTVQRKRSDGMAGAYELLATAALTGARPSELLGLTAEDVSFDRNTILIRGTKTDGAFRSVPLPPQLREILEPYLTPRDRTPRTGLLFRSPKSGERVTDARTRSQRAPASRRGR